MTGSRSAGRRPGRRPAGAWCSMPLPPRGVSRRRLTAGRAEALAARWRRCHSVSTGCRGGRGRAARPARRAARGRRLAARPRRRGGARGEAPWSSSAPTTPPSPSRPGLPLPALRAELALAARRRATLDRAAADEVAGPSWTVSWRTGRSRGTATGCGTRRGPRASRRRRWPRWTGWSWRCRVAAPPSLAAAAREAGCPPDGRSRARGRRAPRPPRGRPRVGRRHVPRPRAPGAGDGRRGAALARRVPRCHRHQPPVRAGDPRGPGPPRAPPSHGGRSRPRTQDDRQAPGPRRRDRRAASRRRPDAPGQAGA